MISSSRWARVEVLWVAILACNCIALERIAATEPTGELPNEPRITEGDREHWSLTPIIRPALPEIENRSWCRNEIDYFIQRQLEENELTGSQHAHGGVLLRRLAFDVTGLPPSVTLAKQFHRYREDEIENRFEQQVDAFLASPAYGERWAQFWLDLARFAETDGFEHDKVRKGVWAYRDWVVNALNANMPYDEFLRLQLAGDLVGSTDERIATVFCTAGPDMPDINEQDLRRFDKLNEVTGTVGSAVLGLTMQCAQCHDHKYDPISQADFFRLRAVFANAIPAMKRDRHVITLVHEEEVPPPRLYHRGDLRRPGPEVEPGFPRVSVSAGAPFLCHSEHPRLELANWLCDPSNPLTARVLVNRLWQHHFGRSLTENPSDFGVVAGGPTHPELLDWLAAELIDSGWDIKHIHRLILTSSTFRQQSSGELEDSVPNTRQNTGQSDSSDNLLALRDELYGSFPRKRLEGETIRDALLATSGLLDRKMAGESVMPPLPVEMVATLLKGHWQVSSNPADHARRSIYVFARRNLRFPLFDVFDRPDAGTSCARRDESTTALQSLELLNGDLSLQCARELSHSLMRSNSKARAIQPDQLVAMTENLFWSVLSRTATKEELPLFTKHLLYSSEALMQLRGTGGAALSEVAAMETALTEAALALFNTNEFLYVD